ncbi:MAG: serine hydrolase [Bacteroidota bacterium]|nr:serine hydrolase [Bacteroidota bacterium]
MKISGVCFVSFTVFLAAGSYGNSGKSDLPIYNPTLVNFTHNNLQQLPDTFINNLLASNTELFGPLLAQKDLLGIQVIYTAIDRGKKKKDKIKFTDHTWNLNPDNYFYPASTVKLPVAILALQKLNELKIPGLDMNSTMITGKEGTEQTDVTKDPSASDDRPTIAHYIKKILLVSDNDAFNRLYEFLGQEYINKSLHQMGYKDIQIIHRLSVSLTEEQNRHTNPVSFFDREGKLLYAKPAEKSRLNYRARNIKLGKGYLQGGQLVNEPFDFSVKNLLPLMDLHQIVRSIIFPEDIPKEQQFDLSRENYNFLRLYMSMYPAESASPVYDSATYWDNYVKMLFYGTEKTKPEPGIRIFNKIGTAYGFLIDAAYFLDRENSIEFMLSAVIYCNSDGIFNDDQYDYASIGYPFLKNLGRVIYEYERTRVRKTKTKVAPNFFNYTY